jgi:predicted outer membrane repeat protein
MSKLKKHSLLLFLIIMIFISIPISFASDLDNTTLSNEVITDDNSDILSDDDEAWIELDKDEYTIDEDDSASISGHIHIEIFDGAYPYELNVECKYNDSDGVLRTYTSSYDGYSFKFNTDNFEGLSARDNPYMLNFTVVKDELFDEFVEGYYIDEIANASASLKINKIIDLGPTVPKYDSFIAEGQIYVSESGNDLNNGSEESPYLTIQKALDRNKALGGSYEIIVKTGWYFFTEAYTISNNVRIIGKGKVEILNGGTTDGYIFFTSGPNIIEFNNLTISGGTSGAISGSTTIGGDGNARKVLNIINCTFEDNSGDVGVITTYSKTTILQSTFINNNAHGFDSYFRGLISARDNSLTVNFCNFIDNTLSSENPIIYSEVKTDANYNFWQSNEGPQKGDINASKLKADNWVVIVTELNDDNVIMGEDYNLNLKFMYINSTGIVNSLNASMPNLDIKINANLGQINSTSTIKNNISILDYKSDVKGLENITVCVNDNLITYLTFNIDVPEIDKIYVSPFGDDGNVGNRTNPLKTIKEAINKNTALGGNKVIIILQGIYEEYNLEINNQVTIIGEGNVSINANKKGRIFLINASADIYNINFTRGFVESEGYGGAIYHNSGKLSIYDSVFDSNYAKNYGGAIASQSMSSLEIYNTIFVSNKISEDSNEFKGSAIYSDSELTIKNSKFIKNVAVQSQGCIYVAGDGTIFNNTFINNRAFYGGAIYVNAGNNANVIISKNNFILNKAKYGGAIYAELSLVCNIENNNFYNNTAPNGGAIYIYGINSQNRIANNVFSENSDDCICIKSAQVDLLNNTILGNGPQINLDSGIIGNVIVVFNENQTLKLKNGEIQLNASVTDDMGNVINGGLISFTSNGNYIGNASVHDGKASIIKEFSNGNYTISGFYSASNTLYPPSEIIDSLIKINVVNYWFINETGYETLQEAIDAADLNDVIRGVPGIYDEPIIQIGHRTRPSEPWVINKNITITSLDYSPVVLKAQDRYIFYIDYYSNVTFRNIIFTGANNPDGWGGSIDSMGKNIIIVENCTFRDNIAEKGAGIFGYGNLYIKDSIFINNTATVYGGAVVKDGDGDFILENVKFINNSAFTYSGAVDCRGYSEVIQIFKNITFEGNTATCGGALYTSGKNVTFIDCIFNNNKAIDKDSGYSPFGGAVYVHNGATRFINTNFTNNYAEGSGGALQLENSVSSVVDSSGRHITIHWGILENCIIENNIALGDGGAIYTGNTFRTHINITNSFINNNTAANGALFVNLYGFYTLNNVTVENNKNTAGSSLIYTYGVYSYPDSFYANTDIINSKFKNNDAERVISTTTIYSSVNIINSEFENEGMILYSYEGSICNLSNVCEINPNSNNLYSIDNTGVLSLSNNIFVNAIYNKATINTPTFIYIMNNETVEAEIGETIELKAIVTDDNMNCIIGEELIFIVNNTEISSTMINNTFNANYKVLVGNQFVNASYDDLGLINLTTKPGIIIGKSGLNIDVKNITAYYKIDKFKVTLTDNKGNPVSDISISVVINDKNYIVDTDINGVALLDLNLPIGNYKVMSTILPNDKYKSITVYSTIQVLSSIESSDLTRGVNSPYDFVARFLDLSGNPLKNTIVTFKVNNNVYNLKTDDNGVCKLVNILNTGTYTITSTNPLSSQISFNKVVIVERITENNNLVMDYNDGSKFKVRIIGDDGNPVGAGEIVKITIKNTVFMVKTDNNGYVSLVIKLVPNNYKVTIEYNGYKVFNKIKVKSVIKAKNISKKRAKKIKYTASLKTSKGKPIAGKKLTFKIKGKTYTAKTNKKGVAKVYLKNLKVGKYKITIKYLKSKVIKTIKIKR